MIMPIISAECPTSQREVKGIAEIRFKESANGTFLQRLIDGSALIRTPLNVAKVRTLAPKKLRKKPKLFEKSSSERLAWRGNRKRTPVANPITPTPSSLCKQRPSPFWSEHLNSFYAIMTPLKASRTTAPSLKTWSVWATRRRWISETWTSS